MRFLYIVFSLMIAMHANAHQTDKHEKAKKLAVSIAFDTQGQLWRVGVNQGFVEVSASSDFGKTFTKPVRANSVKQNIPAKGELRPKIAIGPNDEIYVTWMQNLSKRLASYIWFARSKDGGQSFEKPIMVHQDQSEIEHAFEELAIAPDGTVTVLWLDARDAMANSNVIGNAIYFSVYQAGDSHFLPEKKLADYACECCRLAITTKPNGTVVAMWRHVFEGNERDHMMAEIPKAGEEAKLKRATFGRWKIDGCPHQGGALARGGEGENWWGYHMAYFDGKEKKPGLYYSRMDGEAWVAFPAKKFGNHAKQARHPAVLSLGNIVWLAWLETDANNVNQVMVKTSTDEGKSWSDTQPLLNIEGKIDYPQLVKYKDTAYLVVNTSEGLKVKAIHP
jgi:hypothetical protein